MKNPVKNLDGAIIEAFASQLRGELVMPTDAN